MQQTNFPLEILIHDDCSTDGTTEIIKEYAAKYPDLISPLYEEINQYQQGKASEIDFYNYRRARGKYIAYCEGDDYWTDPLKLQKQVDFMEDNPEYSVCFHDFDELDIRTGRLRKDICAHKNVFSRGDDVEVTVDKFLRNAYLGQPLTMVFRLSAFDLSWRDNYEYYRDTHEIYHLLRAGKGKILGFVPKTHIPNYNEFYEARHFAKAFKDNTNVLINGKEYPFGTNLLFKCRQVEELIVASEICEDLWVPLPPSSYHAINGATVICNLSASNELVGKDKYRLEYLVPLFHPAWFPSGWGSTAPYRRGQI